MDNDNNGGEDDTGRPPENIEMQNMNNEEREQDSEAAERQQQQQETDFGAGQQQQQQQQEEQQNSPGSIGELFQVADERKEELFNKVAGIPLTREMSPELFARTNFLHRKNTLTIQRIEYNGEKIYFIQNGELKPYARETGKQSRARREFDEKLGAVRDAINDDIFKNELEVDRRLNIADLDEADKFFTEANDIFYQENDIALRNDKVREKLEEVEQKIQELEGKDLTEEEQALLDKYKNISDNIRVNLLRGKPKYMKLRIGNNILMNLERLREWLRSRLPLIGAIIGVAAGIFSVVYGIVAWTKGAAVATAKAAHSTGKTIAKILAKLGPIMASIGSFVISLLSYLSQGVLWLANNLWILLLALVGFLYNEYKTRK